MTDKTYKPNPVDTTDIQLPEELVQLTEPLARHVETIDCGDLFNGKNPRERIEIYRLTPEE